MSFVKVRFQQLILLFAVIISLCQFNGAIYYSNKVSGKFPRQGKRAGLDVSDVNERKKFNYLRQRNSNISALRRLYAILGERGLLQDMDQAIGYSSF